ncbi:MAG: hypothetical protein VZR24_05760 [Butyrivibrio hungatei]|nr:hypothetical protein [Butyrivibrio hungatei]
MNLRYNEYMDVNIELSGIIQFVHPRLPVACVAMSLATLILCLVWVDELISLDPLTGLNNRIRLRAL